MEAVLAERNSPQEHVWRARIVLLTADGCGTAEIMRGSGTSKNAVWRWQERFMLATSRPAWQVLPAIGAALERIDRCDLPGRPVLQVFVEEMPQDMPAEIQSCIAAELHLAQPDIRVDFLAVVPGAHGQK